MMIFLHFILCGAFLDISKVPLEKRRKLWDEIMTRHELRDGYMPRDILQLYIIDVNNTESIEDAKLHPEKAANKAFNKVCVQDENEGTRINGDKDDDVITEEEFHKLKGIAIRDAGVRQCHSLMGNSCRNDEVCLERKGDKCFAEVRNGRGTRMTKQGVCDARGRCQMCRDGTKPMNEDAYGDSCEWYVGRMQFCGEYNTTTFKASDMCCSCGAGIRKVCGDELGEECRGGCTEGEGCLTQDGVIGQCDGENKCMSSCTTKFDETCDRVCHTNQACFAAEGRVGLCVRGVDPNDHSKHNHASTKEGIEQYEGPEHFEHYGNVCGSAKCKGELGEKCGAKCPAELPCKTKSGMRGICDHSQEPRCIMDCTDGNPDKKCNCQAARQPCMLTNTSSVQEGEKLVMGSCTVADKAGNLRCAQCIDQMDLTDRDGKTCAAYANPEHVCDQQDTHLFNATSMCCRCGGGSVDMDGKVDDCKDVTATYTRIGLTDQRWKLKRECAYQHGIGKQSCPATHPYAYLSGTYCCKYDEEDVSARGGEACDGSGISFGSTCCKYHAYTKCKHRDGCRDRRGTSCAACGGGQSLGPLFKRFKLIVHKWLSYENSADDNWGELNRGSWKTDPYVRVEPLGHLTKCMKKAKTHHLDNAGVKSEWWKIAGFDKQNTHIFNVEWTIDCQEYSDVLGNLDSDKAGFRFIGYDLDDPSKNDKLVTCKDVPLEPCKNCEATGWGKSKGKKETIVYSIIPTAGASRH